MTRTEYIQLYPEKVRIKRRKEVDFDLHPIYTEEMDEEFGDKILGELGIGFSGDSHRFHFGGFTWLPKWLELVDKKHYAAKKGVSIKDIRKEKVTKKLNSEVNWS